MTKSEIKPWKYYQIVDSKFYEMNISWLKDYSEILKYE